MTSMIKTIPKFRYIGVCGMPGAGKNTCSRHLSQTFGYVTIDLGIIVAEELKNMHLEPTRDNFHKVSIEMRKRDGNAAVVKKAAEEWIPWVEDPRIIQDTSAMRYVFNGVRSIDEIEYLRKEYGHQIMIIGIYATPGTRFLRIQERGREGVDGISLEQFLRFDKEELDIFGIGNALMLVDNMIVNEGTIPEFYKSIQRLIAEETGELGP